MCAASWTLFAFSVTEWAEPEVGSAVPAVVTVATVPAAFQEMLETVVPEGTVKSAATSELASAATGKVTVKAVPDVMATAGSLAAPVGAEETVPGAVMMLPALSVRPRVVVMLAPLSDSDVALVP